MNDPVGSEETTYGAAAPPYPGEAKRGDRGEKVKVWQQMLRERVNPKLKIDGIYGDATFHCATFWQKNRPASRNVDGFMGQYMWHSLVNNVFYDADADEDAEYDPEIPVEEFTEPSTETT